MIQKILYTLRSQTLHIYQSEVGRGDLVRWGPRGQETLVKRSSTFSDRSDTGQIKLAHKIFIYMYCVTGIDTR